jgi:O-antigen/teichoic acid export membrane protein
MALSAVAAAMARLVSIGTALISVPLTLHYLGPERFGMWMTMSSIVAMLTFTDLGIGNGLLSAVADLSGKEDRLGIQAVVSSGFVALSTVAVVLIAILLAAYPFVEWPIIFNVKSEAARTEAGPSLAIFIACFALAMPLSVVQRVQRGLQRGFAASLWQCLASGFGLIGLVLVVEFQGGLGWLVLAVAGGPLLASVLNTIVFFGVSHPDLAPSWRAVSRNTITRIIQSGGFFLMIQLVAIIAYGSDNVIVAQVVGASAVTNYAVTEKMFSLITMATAVVMDPLWPAYGEAIARGDRRWVRGTIVRSLLAGTCMATLLSLPLVFFGARLLEFWVGNLVDPPFMLLAGFGLWRVISAVAYATAMLSYGANFVRFQLMIELAAGFASLTLKILLVAKIGISGIVWGAIIAYLPLQVMMLIFVRQKFFVEHYRIVLEPDANP